MKRIFQIQATDSDDSWTRDFIGEGDTSTECRADAIYIAEQLWGDDLEYAVLDERSML